MENQLVQQHFSTQESESSGPQGKSLAPPAFQLKASSLSDLVSPVQTMALSQGVVQRASINDFNDAKPEHDASHISDALIQGTDEYTALLQAHHLAPADPSILYTPGEITMACRLMVRAMREGQKVDATADAKTYLDRARMQLGVSEQAQSHDGQLKWGKQGPGMQLTEFGKWLLGGGPAPDSKTGNMNCWELVMFSAYEKGFASKGNLATLYTQFNKDMTASSGDVPGTFAKLEAALQGSKPQAYVAGDPKSPRPLPGDLVIFGGGMHQHVAVATGKMIPSGKTEKAEVMSLWTQNNGNVSKTTIEDLNTGGSAIRFFSPKW